VSNLSPEGRTGARTANRFVYFAQQPVRGDRTRVGTDLAWAIGPASLKLEWAQQTNERKRCAGATSSCTSGADLADLVARG